MFVAFSRISVNPFLYLISNFLCMQLGGWAVSGQWNQTDFNSTLSLLMRDYATFPLFSLKVGRDPKKTALRTTKQYIQASSPEDYFCPITLLGVLLKRLSLCYSVNSYLLTVNRLISQICWSPLNGTPRHKSLKLELRWMTLPYLCWFSKYLVMYTTRYKLSPAPFHPDATSLLGSIWEVPGLVGVPAQEQHDPRGHIHISVL